MTNLRYALWIPLVALGGCGGHTLRVAADSDSAATAQPVALAPEPEPDSASRPAAPPARETPDSVVRLTLPTVRHPLGVKLGISRCAGWASGLTPGSPSRGAW